jgi:peptidylprolyl isomerase
VITAPSGSPPTKLRKREIARGSGRREIFVPPALSYGETGVPELIGPNETLVFVIDLVSVSG